MSNSIMLLRYRSGVVGERGRVVHLVVVSAGGEVGTPGVALCGVVLRPELMETVAAGHGMPCSLCLLSHTGASPTLAPADPLAMVPLEDATSSDSDPRAAMDDLGMAGVLYRRWGWPVTVRGEEDPAGARPRRGRAGVCGPAGHRDGGDPGHVALPVAGAVSPVRA